MAYQLEDTIAHFKTFCDPPLWGRFFAFSAKKFEKIEKSV
jgi:hypothetical protein